MSLKKPEEDELEETLTAMDYIPYTLENADAFYRQLEQWNDEDEYTRCIQALDVYKRQSPSCPGCGRPWWPR